MEQTPNKDEFYQLFAKESSESTASNFFSYMLEQYHYQPQRSAEVCPALYEEISNILEKQDYDNKLLHEVCDKYMRTLAEQERRRKLIATISGNGRIL